MQKCPRFIHILLSFMLLTQHILRSTNAPSKIYKIYKTTIRLQHTKMTPQIHNYINADFVPPETGKFQPIENPANGDTIGQVGVSSAKDVNDAVKAAEAAFPVWSNLTTKSRAGIMMKFHALIKEHADELADLIVVENGKNKTEALADGRYQMNETLGRKKI